MLYAGGQGSGRLATTARVRYGQGGTTTTLLSSVTAPVRAKARPLSVAPVVRVTDAWAMIVPLNTVFVPSVAELPTCQRMFLVCAPLIRITWLFPAAVVNVDTIWKIQVAFGSPLPSRVRLPVIPSEGCALVVR